MNHKAQASAPADAPSKGPSGTRRNVTTKQNRNDDVNNLPGGEIGNSPSETPRLIKANLLVLGAIFMISISNAGLVWYGTSAKREVIATTEDGKVTKQVPLSQAFVTESRVLGFVDECLRASFSHDFENYRRTFNAALTCYTSLGGKEFAKAINPLLLDIREKRIVMSVTAEPPALVRGPSLINGRAVWDVQTLVTLYFQGTRERFAPQRRVATVTVVRVPLEESPRGVAINAIQLAPYTGK